MALLEALQYEVVTSIVLPRCLVCHPRLDTDQYNIRSSAAITSKNHDVVTELNPVVFDRCLVQEYRV